MIENVQIKASTLLIHKDVVILARCRKFCQDPVRCCILDNILVLNYEFEIVPLERLSVELYYKLNQKKKLNALFTFNMKHLRLFYLPSI